MNDKITFFLTFIKSPKIIGSITPSSRFLRDEMLRDIDFKNAKYIAEYGPGTGCITTEILKRARNDAKILCFEVNRNFCSHLRRSIKDPRLLIINDSAENVKKHIKKLGIKKFDCIVSSLPFSILPPEEKFSIIKETKSILKNNGKFIVYQYWSNFKKHIAEYFSNISVRFVPLNIPPSFVYVCGR